MLKDAEDLLHWIEEAAQSIGFFLNTPKTKFMHLNPSIDAPLLALNGSVNEKVSNFLYLGSYSNMRHDIDTRISKRMGSVECIVKSMGITDQ